MEDGLQEEEACQRFDEDARSEIDVRGCALLTQTITISKGIRRLCVE